MIRPAAEHDRDAIVAIYNQYVSGSHVTFDVEPFTVATRRAWFEQFAGEGPHRLLVLEREGALAGYAASAPFRAKQAYQTSVETSIYLDGACCGRGLGGPLYAALLDALAAEPSVHRAYAGIALPNPASVRFHERFGFREVGVFREVGFQRGRFWDVAWYEKALDDSPP